MKTRNIASVEAMRALSDEGHGQTEIARRLDCSRQTVWRKLKGYAPKTTRPASNGAPSTGDVLDWPTLQVAAVDMLRDSAEKGSATACVQLARLASVEARAASCTDHVPQEIVNELLLSMFHLFRDHLTGPFARRVNLEFGVEMARILAVVEDGLDDIAHELNKREEAADEAQT